MVTVPILLIDGEDADLALLRPALTGLQLLVGHNRDEALSLLQLHKPPVAILGLKRANGLDERHPGLSLLESILNVEPTTRVVTTSCREDRQLRVEAVGIGGWEALDHPLSPDTLRLVVERAMALTELEREHRRGVLESSSSPLPGVLGESPAMIMLYRQVERVAPTDASVVLTGESGTGKEVLARAMHAVSRRCQRRFVAINCAAIPDNLLESELFGYERGAFTGAVKLTPGRIEIADGGTLFLDEIGDLPLMLQGKLLRFLQERVVERIGGRREIPVDVRVVCATHRDLAALITAGSFREDLYYRLTEIALHLPPLRERAGDAILMAHQLLTRYGAAAAPTPKGYTNAALHAIDIHPWPGNVRELQNRVKRAVIMANGPRIVPADLALPDIGEQSQDLDLRRCRDAVEGSVLRRALARCNGNLTAAARLIGVSRPTLYDLLRHHGLRN